MQPKTILVYVGLDLVGDSLLKLPFIRGLRQAFPEAKITWVAGKRESVLAGVMAPHVAGLVDDVIEHAGIGLSPWEILKRPLGGRAFDLVIDSQKVAYASLTLWRIPHKAFISPFGKFALSSMKPEKSYKWPKHMARQMLDLLELASGETFETPERVTLEISETEEAEAKTLLPDGPVYVGLAPGAGGRPKCWPIENFIALAQKQRQAGRTPVFLMGPQEDQWIGQAREAVPEALFPLQAEGVQERHGFSPTFTMALGERLNTAVCNDAGVGHMMAATQTHLISLFGPTSPEKFRPMTPNLTLIKAQDFGEERQMAQIPVDAVDAAIQV